MERTELSGSPSSVLKFRKRAGLSWAKEGRKNAIRRTKRAVFFIFRSLGGKLAIFPIKIESKVLKYLSRNRPVIIKSLKMIDLLGNSVRFLKSARALKGNFVSVDLRHVKLQTILSNTKINAIYDKAIFCKNGSRCDDRRSGPPGYGRYRPEPRHQRNGCR
jgi:hypothetical protein